MSRIYRSPEPDVSIPECSLFTHLFRPHHDLQRPAYIDAPTGRTLTRADVRARSLQLAWSLRHVLGQARGATLAIFSPNSIAWPVVLFASIAAGLRTTTINSAYTPPELRHQLQDSGAYHIFAHPALLGTVRAALKLMNVSDSEAQKRVILTTPSTTAGSGWRCLDDLLGRGQLEKEESFDGPAAHETAFLCYSSGTTSKSKGVELTHHNIVSGVSIVQPRMEYVRAGDAVMLSVLPFYHIFGLVLLVCNPFYCGVPQVIMPQFTPDDFCANVERYKVTMAHIVPPILVVLSHDSAPEKYDMRSLRVLSSGAAPLSKGLALAVHARLRSVGADVKLPQGWGLTETSPACTVLHETKWKSKAGSVGPLLPNVQARLVLEDGQTDAPEGEPGELWVRGPNVMKGYLNNPEASRNALTHDGWFKTGDVAVIDRDGHVTIVDRMKELIKYKGFQVAPAELEGILLTHPKIMDAAVIGVYSEAEATENPRAYVVPRGGAGSLGTAAIRAAFGQEIQAWMRTKVARHKYLRGGVVVVDAIPKSAAGKILRRELRDLAKRDAHVDMEVGLAKL